MRRTFVRGGAALTCALSLAAAVTAQEPPEVSRTPDAVDPVRRVETLVGGSAPRPEGDEFETDRDSFTPATSTAGRQRLIVESAYSFIDNRRTKETHSVPELILRYGLTERVELRLGWNYEVGGAGAEVTGAESGERESARSGQLVRETTLSYGAKIGVTEQRGWVPRSAIILQGLTRPAGARAPRTRRNWSPPSRPGGNFRPGGGSTRPCGTVRGVRRGTGSVLGPRPRCCACRSARGGRSTASTSACSPPAERRTACSTFSARASTARSHRASRSGCGWGGGYTPRG